MIGYADLPHIRAILQLNGTFGRKFVPMSFHWLFSMQYQKHISTCGACSEVVFEFERRATYFGSLRTKLFYHLLACQYEFDPQWTDIECSHYLQKCIKGLANMEGCCMQNNQLPTETYVELEDNSI